MKIRASKDSDHQQMMEVLTAAFVEYPFFTAFLPEKKHRLDFLNELFIANVLAFEEINGSYVAYDENEQILGVMLVKDDQSKEPGFWSYLRKSRIGMFKPSNLKSLREFFKIIENEDDDIISQEITWYVDSLVVNPKVQSKGVGSFLLKSLDEIVAKNGGTVVLSTNTLPNTEFYEKNGYQKTDYAKSEYGFETWHFQKDIKKDI
ncbi:GNAT family N-acetyltransferase [Lactobacillus sp. YT155]|uniref:GNAT family N-acetyltransferase n=1 Tax=Lactobacillus sp. YT155 TaxID=3060955 RepID=UPI00265E0914|nr:GNAT family N-acetyltransferase [Lactobacillus sp. YT155]MDO1604860.1 GNAT family N-acetyltransferase [Lactobacillus sp. YT155]